MSFLKDYEIFVGNNKAAPLYHIWSGLSAMASFVSRRVWTQQGFFTVYPNMYIILVGDPGSGKSHAMNYARTLVREFPDVTIAPDSVTKEALTQFMAGTPKNPSVCRKNFFFRERVVNYCHLTIFSNELVTLLGAEPINMIKFLTDIWNSPSYEVKTKHQGDDLILGPYINILGCMTPETTSSLLKSQIISGGFSRRCQFIYTLHRGKGVARPKHTPEQQAAFARLRTRAEWLQNLVGEFTWTGPAEVWFDKWYDHKEAEMHKQSEPAMKHYYSSMDEMLLKVAMLIALSEGDELVLTPPCFEAGLAMLQQAEQNLSKVFEGTGRNELNAVLVRVADFVAGLDHPIQEKKLRSAFFSDVNYEEFSKILLQLQETDKVSIALRSNNRYVMSPAVAQALAKSGGAVEDHPGPAVQE